MFVFVGWNMRWKSLTKLFTLFEDWSIQQNKIRLFVSHHSYHVTIELRWNANSLRGKDYFGKKLFFFSFSFFSKASDVYRYPAEYSIGRGVTSFHSADWYILSLRFYEYLIFRLGIPSTVSSAPLSDFQLKWKPIRVNSRNRIRKIRSVSDNCFDILQFNTNEFVEWRRERKSSPKLSWRMKLNACLAKKWNERRY